MSGNPKESLLAHLLDVSQPVLEREWSSLREAVPSFSSLVRAVSSERPSFQLDVDWETALWRNLSNSDADLARQVLFDAQEEQNKKLLVYQFLLQRAPAPIHSFSVLLQSVLLRHGEDKEPIFHQDTFEAALEASFSEKGQINQEAVERVIQACSDHPIFRQQAEWNAAEELKWQRTCRVLACLYRYTGQGMDEVVSSITQCIENSVSSSLEHLPCLLKPLANDLLPLVVQEKENAAYVDRIWKALWLHPTTQETSSLMTITAVLCSILPSFVSRELPSEGDNSSLPVQQKRLWDMIQLCLGQGLRMSSKELEDASSSFKNRRGRGGDDVAPSSALLRRRGLFLLRVLVDSDQKEVHWNQYVACFEVMEMEQEAHLIDQVWETVRDLFSLEDSTSNFPVTVSWDWLSLLLGRVIASPDGPVLRKHSLYRLFQGEAGILLSANYVRKDPGGKGGKKPRKKPQAGLFCGTPLTTMTPDFLFDIILPSFDTLETTIGTSIHLEEGKIVVDTAETMLNFLKTYVRLLPAEPMSSVLYRLVGSDVICNWHCNTVVKVFQCIADALTVSNILINDEVLDRAVASLRTLFSLSSIAQTFREQLLESLAVLLSHTKAEKLSPQSILGLLVFYPLPETSDSDWVKKTVSMNCLCDWLQSGVNNEAGWSARVGGTIATAFVDGMLLDIKDDDEWDPCRGPRDLELSYGAAVALFCTLASAKQTDSTLSAANELLWPAIHKGIQNASAATVHTVLSYKVTRALLLLENGCRLQVLTGMGNGDLILDSKTNQMVPPPPNIETMLAEAFYFLQNHIRLLLTVDGEDGFLAGDLERARKLSSTFSGLVTQLQYIYKGFPSSMAIASSVEKLLKDNLQRVRNGDVAKEECTKPLCLVYVALLCGGENVDCEKAETFASLTKLSFAGPKNVSRNDQLALLSVFEYSRWGSLFQLLKSAPHSGIGTGKELQGLFVDLFEKASEVAEAAPLIALRPMLHTVLAASRMQLLSSAKDSPVDGPKCLENISRIIFDLMAECSTAKERLYMINGMSSLLFHPSLLFEEYERLHKDEDALDPIRSAFRRLLEKAGTNRPYISKVVVISAAAGWLGPSDSDQASIGKAAIPYLDDIARLLLHKENSIKEASGVVVSTVDDNEIFKQENVLPVPDDLHSRSIARGALLVFFDNLPGLDMLSQETVRCLIEPLILKLLGSIRDTGNRSIMLGTAEYCLKSRGWQALCVLSRFVTDEIVGTVCEKVFLAMEEPLHGQIRYFIEVFTIQCSRKFPEPFADALVKQLTRHDLTLQMVASLMIVAGNLIVGRYQKDFLPIVDGSRGDSSRLGVILSGAIPWLSSTQGFSRAIAQLLVHKLVPMTIDLDSPPTTADCYARSIFSYLEGNKEMQRLRRKQNKFFESYEVDARCTAEGVLKVPVDEGGEAHPIHMVEAIKVCLKEVYAEAHSDDAPAWKQVEIMMKAQHALVNDLSSAPSDTSLVNFQRKIIPLDALNLSLEEIKEKRTRNAARRKKQDLIVCASLIDKVPNLAGLARTSEIFAVDRLVVPDRTVTKMDNFSSISVGAGDWIEIEECREQDLLPWLRKKKDEGYFVVGLEQTSSSVGLTDFSFPPNQSVVLLLGKEKEGIPIEFLQSVDQCVEIPQMGIIRSLNVHVSGAITIWEHTKQKLLNKDV